MMITKSAENKSNFTRNVHLTNSARQGWELILSGLKPASKILLPSYIGITDREGSGIYDPVIKVGIEHDFYLLNDDLTISVAEIESYLKKGEYKLILLVHYFGFLIQNSVEIKRVCKKYNVLVVEDCAHLYNYNLFDYSTAGTHGDYAFYSLHKYFPFTGGGMLVQNNLKLKPLDYSSIELNNNLYAQLIKYDVRAIAEKRRKNFLILEKLLVDVLGITPLKVIRVGDIPHNYPIIIEDGLREKLYFWLIERNVLLIALYYRLINPLQNEKYRTMQNISDNILNLPVHQDMDKENLTIIVELLKKGITEVK